MENMFSGYERRVFKPEGNYEMQSAKDSLPERRIVGFVIFVMDALSFLKWMDGEADNEARNLLDVSFSCPHGGLLSHVDRARVGIYLELLRVPPVTRIFDIPDECHPETKLALDMLTYPLMHAGNNFPAKSMFPCNVRTISIRLSLLYKALSC